MLDRAAKETQRNLFDRNSLFKLSSKISAEHFNRSAPQACNTNAKKMTKLIKIGWLHKYGMSGGLKQVRSPNGGETRTVDVLTEAKMDCSNNSTAIILSKWSIEERSSS